VWSRAAARLAAVSPVSCRLRRAVPSRCSLSRSCPWSPPRPGSPKSPSTACCRPPFSLVVPEDALRSWSRAPDECRAAEAFRLRRIPKDASMAAAGLPGEAERLACCGSRPKSRASSLLPCLSCHFPRSFHEVEGTHTPEGVCLHASARRRTRGDESDLVASFTGLSDRTSPAVIAIKGWMVARLLALRSHGAWPARTRMVVQPFPLMPHP
jgi:hypothetical protein